MLDAGSRAADPSEQSAGRRLVLAADGEALVLRAVAHAVDGPAAAARRGGRVAGVRGAEGARWFVRAGSRSPAVPVCTDDPVGCREVVPAFGAVEDAALVGGAVPRELDALDGATFHEAGVFAAEMGAGHGEVGARRGKPAAALAVVCVS